MFAALLVSSAWSADYTAADVLRAWSSGMPDPVVGAIAERVTDTTADEKRCLLHAGVPTSIVDGMDGPAPTDLPPDVAASVCRRLGLDPDALPVPEAELRSALAAEASARRTQTEATAAFEARVDCFRPRWGVLAKTDAETAIEEWMRAQVRAGATGFVSVANTVTIEGSGGTTALLCSW